MGQQTAVEFLVNKLNAIIGKTLVDPMVALSVMHIVIKAKQMEKEQIMDACAKFHVECIHNIKDFEQYYNKTYGENKD